MKKQTYTTDKELTDEQWSKIELLSQNRSSREKAVNVERLITRVWKESSGTGARWRDMPERFPSRSTCWRRLTEWQAQGIWLKIWQTFLGLLDKKSRLKWENVFADGMFVPAKKGGRQ